MTDASDGNTRPYRAFASYATDPDAKLVQRIEAFLETLDKNRLVPEALRTSVQLCVDGSDFTLPRGPRETLEDLVATFLKRADFLLVLSGPHAIDHPWIRWEIRWWLEHREPETILLALTHGDDPSASPARLHPPEIVKAGLHAGPWFDLRGSTRSRVRRLQRVRSFDRELVRLAAFLIDPDLAANDLIAHYDEAAAKRRGWLLAQRAATALVATAAVAGLLFLGSQLLTRSREATASRLASLSALSTNQDHRGIALALAAMRLDPRAEHKETLVRATQGWLPHVKQFEPATQRPSGSIALIAGERFLVSGGYDGVLAFHEIATGSLVHQIEIGPRIDVIEAHPHRPVIAAGTRKGAYLIDVRSIADRAPIQLGSALLDDAAFAITLEPGSENFLVGTISGTVAEFLPEVDEHGNWSPIRRITEVNEDGASIGVSGLAATPDGDVLVITGLRGDLRAYSMSDWSAAKWRRKYTTSIRSLAMSPLGGIAAFADRDGDVVLFDPRSGEELRRAPRPVATTQVANDAHGRLAIDRSRREARTALAFSPDGQLLTVSSFDRSIELLDAGTLQVAGRAALADFAREALFTSDGATMFASGDDGIVHAYRVQPEIERLRLAQVTAFTIAPDAAWIAVVPESGGLWMLDPRSARRVRSTETVPRKPPTKKIRQIVTTGDGATIAALLSTSNRLRRWRVDSNARGVAAVELKPLEHAFDPVDTRTIRRLAAEPTGSRLITVTDGRQQALHVWDAVNGGVGKIETFSSDVSDLAVGANVAAVGLFDGTVRMFALSTGHVVIDEVLEHPIAVVAVSGNGRRLFASAADGSALLCERGGDRDSSLAAEPSSAPGLTGKTTAPDLVTDQLSAAPQTPASEENSPQLRTACVPLALGSQAVAASFNGSGSRLAVALEQRLVVLDATDRWHPQALVMEPSVRTIAMSTDGTLLAASAADELWLWDTDNNTPLIRLEVPNDVAQVALLPAAHRPVITLDGDTMRLWDWREDVLVAEACSRWPAHLAIEGASAIPARVSRSELCGQEHTATTP